MKCTGKGISVFSVLVFSCVLLTGCQSENTVAKYEAENYNNLYEGHLYAEDLCVSKDDVEIEDFTGDSSLHAAGLFNIDDKTVDYAYNIHEKIYPASTTEDSDCFISLWNFVKFGRDCYSKSRSAAAIEALTLGAQATCGLSAGGGLTSMDALLMRLCCLHSGNDCAAAIAEHAGDRQRRKLLPNLMNTESRRTWGDRIRTLYIPKRSS